MKKLLILSLLLMGCTDTPRMQCPAGKVIIHHGYPGLDYDVCGIPFDEYKRIEKQGPELKPGTYKYIDKKSGYYGCVGLISGDGSDMLDDNGHFQYIFNVSNCNLHFEFTFDKVKRIGNVKLWYDKYDKRSK